MATKVDGEQLPTPRPADLGMAEMRVLRAALEITKGSSNVIEISAALHVAAVAISTLREQAGQTG